jgi:hypothetical protein
MIVDLLPADIVAPAASSPRLPPEIRRRLGLGGLPASSPPLATASERTAAAAPPLAPLLTVPPPPASISLHGGPTAGAGAAASGEGRDRDDPCALFGEEAARPAAASTGGGADGRPSPPAGGGDAPLLDAASLDLLLDPCFQQAAAATRAP